MDLNESNWIKMDHLDAVASFKISKGLSNPETGGCSSHLAGYFLTSDWKINDLTPLFYVFWSPDSISGFNFDIG